MKRVAIINQRKAKALLPSGQGNRGRWIAGHTQSFQQTQFIADQEQPIKLEN